MAYELPEGFKDCTQEGGHILIIGGRWPKPKKAANTDATTAPVNEGSTVQISNTEDGEEERGKIDDTRR